MVVDYVVAIDPWTYWSIGRINVIWTAWKMVKKRKSNNYYDDQKDIVAESVYDGVVYGTFGGVWDAVVDGK